MTDPRPPLPPGFGVALDPGVRRLDGGRVLLGGSPLRLLRLSPAGSAVVDALAAGEGVSLRPAAPRPDGLATPGSTGFAKDGEPEGYNALRGTPAADPARPADGQRERARQMLARRLLDGGFAHPRPSGPPSYRRGDVTILIPVWRDAAGLAATLAAVAGDGAALVVVDDASPSPQAERIAAVAAAHGADLVRRATNGGPGAARTTGLVGVDTALVAFLDAGVEPQPGWLDRLLAHFADPEVVAAAPRVGSRPTAAAGVLDRYERRHSPLDLGPDEARVAPRARVAYVPTAALVLRRDALDAVGGFDPTLRTGEDVDLVFRLVAAGGVVRYEPSSLVSHPARATWPRWVAQRVGYGGAAAPLDRRHPGQVPPLAVSGWSVTAWTLIAAGHPLAGVGVAGATTALLARKLAPSLEHPVVEAVRLGGRGHLHAGRWLARALTRTWWPFALVAALVSRRARGALVAAVVVPPLLDRWSERRRATVDGTDGRPDDAAIDPVRYLAVRLADDVAYGWGVWRGCLAQRHLGALRPDLGSWPGPGRGPGPDRAGRSDRTPA